MRRAIEALTLSLLFVLGSASCGYSSDEAKTKCDLARDAQGNCFNDATYDACISCFEDCGQECVVAESCPVQYSCPE